MPSTPNKMKKTKFKIRLENAVNAFFDNENLVEKESLTIPYNMNLYHEENLQDYVKNKSFLSKVLKQTLLFLPGTFILFYMSIGTVFFLVDIFTKVIYIPWHAKERLIFAYLIVFFSIFMTWSGLGNLRKLKHLVIPSSVVTVGILLGIGIRIATDIWGAPREIMYGFDFLIYLFPLALIVPILAKDWVDGLQQDSK